MFSGIPDPLVRDTDPDPSTINQKYFKKPLIPTVLWLLYDFFSLKNDVNVPSKSNKQFFVDIMKVTDENSRIRIRIRIRIQIH